MNRRRTRQQPVLPVVGIDIGGVIVDRAAEDSDTSFFGRHPMETPAVPGAFDAIGRLMELFEDRVHIVSKAGPRIAKLSQDWLAERGAFNDAGIHRANLHFVRQRHEKSEVCERLGITHFVDDRLDVLAHLTTVEHRYLFVGGLGQHKPPSSVPKLIRTVPTWPALVSAIEATLERWSTAP